MFATPSNKPKPGKQPIEDLLDGTKTPPVKRHHEPPPPKKGNGDA